MAWTAEHDGTLYSRDPVLGNANWEPIGTMPEAVALGLARFEGAR